MRAIASKKSEKGRESREEVADGRIVMVMFPADVWEKVCDVAEKEGTDPSAVVSGALAEYIGEEV